MPFSKTLRRVSRYKAAFRNITHHHTARRDHAAIPNPHAGQYYRLGADMAALTNPSVQMTVPDVIMAQNGGAEGNAGVTPNVQAARISFVEVGLERNFTVRANIHFPN